MKTMKNIFRASLVFLISFSLSTLDGQTVREVGDFTEVSASTSVKVKLIKSNENKVEFKMTGGYEKSLVTEVKNDKLIIKIKHKGMFRGNNKTKAAVKVYYTDLEEISASAGASIKAEEPIEADEMEIEVSSGAVLDLEIVAGEIEAEASSGGRILLEGSAKDGKYEVNSGAHIDAMSMICDNVKAEANSGGHLKVYVNKKLNADASSGGSIRYKGDVDYVDSDSRRSGKIKRIK